MNKILTLKDDVQLNDLLNEDKESISNGNRCNYIVVKDSETGAVLQVRKNLVVRKGREFNLRKIFGIPFNNESLDMLNKRFINLFGIGSGGTPVSDPYTPYAPTPADANLTREVPFRTVASGQALTSVEQNIYKDVRSTSGGSNYFKKTFTRSQIVLDNNNDDYYVKLTLDITDKDARGTIISELGLFSSEQSGNSYIKPVIVTRVTFQSEPLSVETRKGLTIDYYVYS